MTAVSEGAALFAESIEWGSKAEGGKVIAVKSLLLESWMLHSIISPVHQIQKPNSRPSFG